MTAPTELIEIEVIPLPSETLESTQEKLISEARAALLEEGHPDLLDSGDIRIEAEKTAPFDLAHAALHLTIHIVSHIGWDLFKDYILPRWKKISNVQVKPPKK